MVAGTWPGWSVLTQIRFLSTISTICMFNGQNPRWLLNKELFLLLVWSPSAITAFTNPITAMVTPGNFDCQFEDGYLVTSGHTALSAANFWQMVCSPKRSILFDGPRVSRWLSGQFLFGTYTAHFNTFGSSPLRHDTLCHYFCFKLLEKSKI